VDLDPDLRKKLFDGEINLFECEKCEYKAYIPISLMYHDMGRQFAVQYYPIESLDDPKFIEMFEVENPPRIKGLPKEMGYLAQPHIVFNMTDLLACILFHEKIRTNGLGKETNGTHHKQ
jgi:hypothetical protein